MSLSTFAQTLVEEVLPEEMRFRVGLNASYDGNPLHPDETVFPEDSSDARHRLLRDCSLDEAIALLWREGLVPEWVNLSVVSETTAATIIQVLSCGRFTREENLLYHEREGRPPFHVLGPTLPIGWVSGQKFSLHQRSSCASLAELDTVAMHADRVWSLELEGHVFDDSVLSRLPDLPALELLELQDSPVCGLALSTMNRYPRLRVLRVRLSSSCFCAGDIPSLSALTTLELANLPDTDWGFARWIRRLPRLDWLTLHSSGDLCVDGVRLNRLSYLSISCRAKVSPVSRRETNLVLLAELDPHRLVLRQAGQELLDEGVRPFRSLATYLEQPRAVLVGAAGRALLVAPAMRRGRLTSECR